MENNLENKNSIFLRTIASMVAVIIILNLAYLDLFMYKTSKSQEEKIQATANVSAPTSNYSNQMCPNSCLNQIYQATSSSKITPQTVGLIAPTVAPTATPAPTITPTSAFQVKEFFIPFGGGTNSSDDWEDVGGLKTSIDSSNYSSIKSTVFEASISVPTGDQTTYVRLFNETDKHPVWFSDISLEGKAPQLLISKPITLDSGNKTYKVQMKTSLKYQATLNQARIHIIIK
jgi:hypothetical protein